MRGGLLALGVAFIYYAAAYGLLTLLKARPDRLFLYSTIPLVIAGVIWTAWALGKNLWGGIIIALMLLISAILAWMAKRLM